VRAAASNMCFQRLRSLHMKPWIIAALICSASAAYAAEDDNKIHPTCVEENNTRRCWVDHGPPVGVRAPQLQPVAPAPQAAIPPPPPRWLPPPLIFRFGPYGLIVPRRYRPVERRLTEPRGGSEIAYPNNSSRGADGDA
jgi:hypothetical protein